ncbi:MAG: periplasmic nitrate reductase, NapE protein [Geminicoccaceae bacterium]
MSPQNRLDSDDGECVASRGEELRAFLMFTVVLAPLAAVACVGGYGFIVWMLQLIYGPPTGG